MKRLLSFLALTAAISFLVACSSQESMNGEYYEIGDYGTDVVITANITGSECQYYESREAYGEQLEEYGL